MKYAVFKIETNEFMGFSEFIDAQRAIYQKCMFYEIDYKPTLLRRIKFLFTGKL